MKILNSQVVEDLAAKVPLDLDFGSGLTSASSRYAVDIAPLSGVSIQADLNEPLDLIPDNSVRSITSRHCFEHIENLVPLMKEIHRILMPGGQADISVPHFSNPYGFSDPTHVRFFGLYTMFYFSGGSSNGYRRRVPGFYFDFKFEIEKISIALLRGNGIERVLLPFIPKVINSSKLTQELYERRFCNLLPAEEIRYVLRPVKD